MQAFFKDDGFNFETLIALGGAQYGASDIGEVLTVVDGIKNGDHAGWVREWRAMGERVRREAAASTHWRGRALAELRASNYISLAQAHADGVEGEDGLFGRLYEEHRAAWDAFVEWWQPQIRPFEIPYGDTGLDAWLFRAEGSDEPRRTLVFNNGSDGAVTAAWVQGIAEALARGWNAVTFDGPGQNSSLVRKQLYFRPDWEAVMTSVVDAVAARREVDEARLAVLGVSQGGYWVPRSLAFEHRFRAAVADPGVVDVSEAMTAHVGHLGKALDAGDREKFDREMAWGSRFSKSIRYTFAFRFRPYGLESPFDVFRRAQQFRLTDELIGQIKTPLLVTDPDDEVFWPGQPRALYERLTGDKDLVRFTAEEGANFHCEPAGNAVRAQRIFDWLEEKVPARSASG